MPRCWVGGDGADGGAGLREMLEEEETGLRDGRMQVYQAVRLALYAASLSQVYVRSVVDYVRRRGEKAETSPQFNGQNYPNKPKTPFPCKSRQGLSPFFLSAHCDSSIARALRHARGHPSTPATSHAT